MLQELADKLPPELIGPSIASLMLQDVRRGKPTRVAGVAETSDQEIEAIQRELELLTGRDSEEKGE